MHVLLGSRLICLLLLTSGYMHLVPARKATILGQQSKGVQTHTGGTAAGLHAARASSRKYTARATGSAIVSPALLPSTWLLWSTEQACCKTNATEPRPKQQSPAHDQHGTLLLLKPTPHLGTVGQPPCTCLPACCTCRCLAWHSSLMVQPGLAYPLTQA
jgi:hypothetical protein